MLLLKETSKTVMRRSIGCSKVTASSFSTTKNVRYGDKEVDVSKSVHLDEFIE
jgi:hypothetical protein